MAHTLFTLAPQCCIIEQYKGGVKEGSVTISVICLLICMLISKHQIGHIKVTVVFLEL